MPWRPVLALLALALVAGPAQGATLASLQEPVRSGAQEPLVVPFTVTEEEAARRSWIVIRTDVNRMVGIELLDAQGRKVWSIPQATNGVRPFAPGNLTEGAHKLVVRGPAEVQVTHRGLQTIHSDEGPTRVEDALDGTHAYLFQSQRAWNVTIDGDVRVDWLPMGREREAHEGPVTLTTVEGQPYVITLRGEPGTAYAIAMEPTGAPAAQDDAREAPAPTGPLMAIAVALVGVVLARRRARRE